MWPTVLLVLVVAHLLGLLSSISALMSVRTPQGTIAWVISLNTLPLLAVPAYWFLGRSKFRGYKIARQSEDSDLKDTVRKLKAAATPFLTTLDGDQGRIQAVERLAKMPFVARNDLDLLIDGQATFESIFAGIDKARAYLLVQFFIVHDDAIGRELRLRLQAAAKRGVRVYFLYDEVGSHKLPRAYLRDLRSHGVETSPFNTTRGVGNRFQLNFRNHRKIVVADGCSGWVGGLNVGDEYLGRSSKFGPWRDTHMKIVGPAVMGLQLSFLEDWNWATGQELDVNCQPAAAPNGNAPVLILPSGPADELETASLMFQHAIHSATQRIWIASPYFVPDEAIVGALHLASLRGVDVRLMVPDTVDHLLVYMSAFAFVGEMLRAGIKIYRYKEGFLHQKVFLVDDVVSGVGTANLDNRSFRLNFEITAIIVDRNFARETEAMFLTDFERARLMTDDELAAKPAWFRIAARAAYLSAPVQ